MLSQSMHYAKKGVFTVLALFLAFYVAIILMTYTPNDPSWSHISSNINEVSNIGGVVGAWIADLLHSFLGKTAWLLLVFFIFESVVLWRDRVMPFLGLRMIAHVFLLLSLNGLLSGIGMLITNDSQGMFTYGGIVGFEVFRRLSYTLTTIGAVIFLLLFTFITATYGFDIHWQKIYHRLIKIKSKDEPTYGLDEEYPDHSSLDDRLQDKPERANGTALNHKYNGSTDGTSQTVSSPVHEQLPLDLPEDNNQTDLAIVKSLEKQPSAQSDNNFAQQNSIEQQLPPQEPVLRVQDASLSNLFSKFLDSSGLSSTLLDLQKEEAEAAAAARLAEEEYINSNKKEEKHKKTTNAVTMLNTITNNSRAKDLKSASFDDPKGDMKASEFDKSVAELWQDMPVEDRLAASVDMTPTNTPPSDPTQPVAIKMTVTAADGEAVDDNVTNDKATNDNVTNDKVTDDKVTDDKVTDDKVTDDKVTDGNAKKEPNIRFAVAEGERNNQIEAMGADADRLDKIMPSIEDDDAFKSKSRSMQTAKYRHSLSPIPDISILDKPDPDRKPSYTEEELEQLSALLEIKLQDFNVKATVVNAIPGPVVTRFEVDLAAGVKASKVTGISRDLARSLSMASLRVVEVIPGKPYIGIEVPNKKREMVRLIELLTTPKYKDPKAQISMAMGKDIGGKPIITDLARAPHMLVAGTTGSGKSVLVNAMLLSILLKYKPDELRLILIDPKQLELANYNDIPHLLTPVVTDMNEAASSLSWCVAEMERRYQLMSLLKVRKLGEFNKKVIAAQKSGKPMVDPLWRPNGSVSIDQAPKLKTLPMIVIVADEFADMIMQVGKQAEELITRLAQKSRAAGIHLMLATQRPSVDVITGLIKANIPVRAALRVNSKVDSRTILDSGGAEDMLGNGDMLFLGPGQIEPDRVHGAYVSDEEVNRVCDAWRERGAPDYIENMGSNFEVASSGGGGNTSGEDDTLYDEAVAFIMETRKVSASSIQRKFSIGYNRAARIVDSMEEAGLVSAMGKSGKRELLM